MLVRVRVLVSAFGCSGFGCARVWLRPSSEDATRAFSDVSALVWPVPVLVFGSANRLC